MGSGRVRRADDGRRRGGADAVSAVTRDPRALRPGRRAWLLPPVLVWLLPPVLVMTVIMMATRGISKPVRLCAALATRLLLNAPGSGRTGGLGGHGARVHLAVWGPVPVLSAAWRVVGLGLPRRREDPWILLTARL